MNHPFVKYLMERDLIPHTTSRHLNGKTCLVREPLGMIAVGHGMLDSSQIDMILDRQRESSERFGEIAISLGFLTPEQVRTLIKIQEFRAASVLAEALALAGVLRYEDAVRYLGAFLAGDEELISMVANP
ncbi:MAG: hypothetical protein HY718_19975 [Planctomycetes bacterium]|nr:hypothetical protein [Planctomycetota bacterium]